MELSGEKISNVDASMREIIYYLSVIQEWELMMQKEGNVLMPNLCSNIERYDIQRWKRRVERYEYWDFAVFVDGSPNFDEYRNVCFCVTEGEMEYFMVSHKKMQKLC
jgi:hypothetical protein